MPSKPEDIQGNNTKTDIVNSVNEGSQSNKFVLTPDYIQQSEFLCYLQLSFLYIFTFV